MALATITARVNATDKAVFDAFCDSVGLTASAAINLFVKKVNRDRRIPFEITDEKDPFYDPVNIRYVMKSVNELRNGGGTVHDLLEDDDDE